LSEVRQKGSCIKRIGSKEVGQKWSEVAAAINTHADFAVMPRDQRPVRERFNKLLSDFNAKMQKEKKASGISPDDLSEEDLILEEIQEVITSNAIAPCAPSDKGISESEGAKALTTSNRAMTSWGRGTAEDGNEEECISLMNGDNNPAGVNLPRLWVLFLRSVNTYPVTSWSDDSKSHHSSKVGTTTTLIA